MMVVMMMTRTKEEEQVEEVLEGRTEIMLLSCYGFGSASLRRGSPNRSRAEVRHYTLRTAVVPVQKGSTDWSSEEEMGNINVTA